MIIRIAGTVNDSIVDGPGFRFTVFAQGCAHGCEGCHNPETHDVSGGREINTQEIIDAMAANPLLDGLTLSGGEPFLQPEPCTALARAAHGLSLNVWVYTGYTFEDLCSMGDAKISELLANCDVLVDGKFQLPQRTLELRFRGSRNQRLIDVKASLSAGHAVEYAL